MILAHLLGKGFKKLQPIFRIAVFVHHARRTAEPIKPINNAVFFIMCIIVRQVNDSM